MEWSGWYWMLVVVNCDLIGDWMINVSDSDMLRCARDSSSVRLLLA